MADYYLHKTAAHIDELLEKVEGLNNYDDTEVRGLINNKVDKVIGKGLSTNDFTDAYKETLDGLDAALDSKVDKETGKGLSTNDFTNAYKTELDGLDTALDAKVDKETGKGLSTNDYTTSEKTKLNSIESGANVNVQSDWNQTDDTADDFIKNKPNIPAGVVVDQVYDGTSTNAQSGVAIAGALSDKVDKVTGKGLSTNDFTDAYKTAVDGAAPQSTTYTKDEVDTALDEKLNKSDVDSTLSSTSTNPVQNKVIQSMFEGCSFFVDTLDKKTFTFTIQRRDTQSRYHYGLFVCASTYAPPTIFFIFVGTTNDVTIVKLAGDSGIAYTGSIVWNETTGTLTITSDGTSYGGIRGIWFD